MLVSANRAPFPTYRKSTFRTPMISSLCTAPHEQERQRRGTIKSRRGHPSEGNSYTSRLPALVFNHFDIQSRRGHPCEGHSYSSRLPTLVFNHFDFQSRRGHPCEGNSYTSRLPALVFNHFDIQSRRGHPCEGHSYSSRLPTLVFNHLDFQSRRGYLDEIRSYSCRLYALVLNFSPLRLSEHRTGPTWCQHHLQPSQKTQTKTNTWYMGRRVASL